MTVQRNELVELFGGVRGWVTAVNGNRVYVMYVGKSGGRWVKCDEVRRVGAGGYGPYGVNDDNR